MLAFHTLYPLSNRRSRRLEDTRCAISFGGDDNELLVGTGSPARLNVYDVGANRVVQSVALDPQPLRASQAETGEFDDALAPTCLAYSSHHGPCVASVRACVRAYAPIYARVRVRVRASVRA